MNEREKGENQGLLLFCHRNGRDLEEVTDIFVVFVFVFRSRSRPSSPSAPSLF